MGNSESSSSQFPYRGNNNESDDESKKKKTEEQTSAASSAIKVGAAIAGTALLALGAWNLASSSDSNEENNSQNVGVTDRSGLGGSSSPKRNLRLIAEGHTRNYGYHGPPSKSIKIMSYNVWSGEVEVAERMEAIGQLIQNHSPDIIMFQEVTPIIYQIFQRSELWKQYKCSVTPERAKRKYFCMLLSKLPVKHFGVKPFENSQKEICLAELDLGTNNNLVVATTHLKSPNPPTMNYSSMRIAQAKEAISFLNNWPNVVFGGDMNWDESFDGPFPIDDDWVDACTVPEGEGWTYPRLKKRLDRFLCKLRDFKTGKVYTIGKKALPELSYRHNNKENPLYPSDHFGLLLTISTL